MPRNRLLLVGRVVPGHRYPPLVRRRRAEPTPKLQRDRRASSLLSSGGCPDQNQRVKADSTRWTYQ
jgi:hypothetical protein